MVSPTRTRTGVTIVGPGLWLTVAGSSAGTRRDAVKTANQKRSE